MIEVSLQRKEDGRQGTDHLRQRTGNKEQRCEKGDRERETRNRDSGKRT